jgi:hypothetical protein
MKILSTTAVRHTVEYCINFYCLISERLFVLFFIEVPIFCPCMCRRFFCLLSLKIIINFHLICYFSGYFATSPCCFTFASISN